MVDSFFSRHDKTLNSSFVSGATEPYEIKQFGKIEDPDEQYKITGASNKNPAYDPFPVVIGRIKMTPNLGIRPFSFYRNNQQYLVSVFHFGTDNNLEISDITIDNVRVGELSSVYVLIPALGGILSPGFTNVDSINGSEVLREDDPARVMPVVDYGHPRDIVSKFILKDELAQEYITEKQKKWYTYLVGTQWFEDSIRTEFIDEPISVQFKWNSLLSELANVLDLHTRALGKLNTAIDYSTFNIFYRGYLYFVGSSKYSPSAMQDEIVKATTDLDSAFNDIVDKISLTKIPGLDFSNYNNNMKSLSELTDPLFAVRDKCKDQTGILYLSCVAHDFVAGERWYLRTDKLTQGRDIGLAFYYDYASYLRETIEKYDNFAKFAKDYEQDTNFVFRQTNLNTTQNRFDIYLDTNKRLSVVPTEKASYFFGFYGAYLNLVERLETAILDKISYLLTIKIGADDLEQKRDNYLAEPRDKSKLMGETFGKLVKLYRYSMDHKVAPTEVQFKVLSRFNNTITNLLTVIQQYDKYSTLGPDDLLNSVDSNVSGVTLRSVGGLDWLSWFRLDDPSDGVRWTTGNPAKTIEIDVQMDIYRSTTVNKEKVLAKDVLVFEVAVASMDDNYQPVKILQSIRIREIYDSDVPLRKTYTIWEGKSQNVLIGIRKLTGDSTGDVHNRLNVMGIKLYQDDNVDYSWQRRIGMIVKASDATSSRLKKVTALVSRKIPLFRDDKWITDYTSNPAWWLLWWLKGKRTEDGRRLYGGGLSEMAINMVDIYAFATWCDLKKLTVNMVVDGSETVQEVANKILACGRAKMISRNGIIGVYWDDDNLKPGYLFCDANITSDSFKITWADGFLADRFSLAFPNEANNWIIESVTSEVVSEDLQRTSVTALKLVGCTNPDMAKQHVALAAAAQVYLRTEYVFVTDLEGRLVNKGDVIYVSNSAICTRCRSGSVLAISKPEVDTLNVVHNLDDNIIGARIVINTPDGKVRSRVAKLTGNLLEITDTLPRNYSPAEIAKLWWRISYGKQIRCGNVVNIMGGQTTGFKVDPLLDKILVGSSITINTPSGLRTGKVTAITDNSISVSTDLSDITPEQFPTIGWSIADTNIIRAGGVTSVTAIVPPSTGPTINLETDPAKYLEALSIKIGKWAMILINSEAYYAYVSNIQGNTFTVGRTNIPTDLTADDLKSAYIKDYYHKISSDRVPISSISADTITVKMLDTSESVGKEITFSKKDGELDDTYQSSFSRTVVSVTANSITLNESLPYSFEILRDSYIVMIGRNKLVITSISDAGSSGDRLAGAVLEIDTSLIDSLTNEYLSIYTPLGYADEQVTAVDGQKISLANMNTLVVVARSIELSKLNWVVQLGAITKQHNITSVAGDIVNYNLSVTLQKDEEIVFNTPKGKFTRKIAKVNLRKITLDKSLGEKFTTSQVLRITWTTAELSGGVTSIVPPATVQKGDNINLFTPLGKFTRKIFVVKLFIRKPPEGGAPKLVSSGGDMTVIILDKSLGEKFTSEQFSQITWSTADASGGVTSIVPPATVQKGDNINLFTPLGMFTRKISEVDLPKIVLDGTLGQDFTSEQLAQIFWVGKVNSSGAIKPSSSGGVTAIVPAPTGQTLHLETDPEKYLEILGCRRGTRLWIRIEQIGKSYRTYVKNIQGNTITLKKDVLPTDLTADDLKDAFVSIKFEYRITIASIISADTLTFKMVDTSKLVGKTISFTIKDASNRGDYEYSIKGYIVTAVTATSITLNKHLPYSPEIMLEKYHAGYGVFGNLGVASIDPASGPSGDRLTLTIYTGDRLFLTYGGETIGLTYDMNNVGDLGKLVGSYVGFAKASGEVYRKVTAITRETLTLDQPLSGSNYTYWFTREKTLAGNIASLITTPINTFTVETGLPSALINQEIKLKTPEGNIISKILQLVDSAITLEFALPHSFSTAEIAGMTWSIVVGDLHRSGNITSISRKVLATGKDTIYLDSKTDSNIVNAPIIFNTPDGIVESKVASYTSSEINLAEPLPREYTAEEIPLITWALMVPESGTVDTHGAKPLKITNMVYTSGETIRITAQDYNPKYYQSENDPVISRPGYSQTLVTVADDLGVQVEGLHFIETKRFTRTAVRIAVAEINWNHINGAYRYIIEYGPVNGSLVIVETTTPTFSFDAKAGEYIVHVSAVTVQGTSDRSSLYFTVRDLPIPATVPTNLNVRFVSNGILFTWDESPDDDYVSTILKLAPPGTDWNDQQAELIANQKADNHLYNWTTANTYELLVKHVNRDGPSIQPARYIFTVDPPQKVMFLSVDVQENTVVIRWNKARMSQSIGGYEIRYALVGETFENAKLWSNLGADTLSALIILRQAGNFTIFVRAFDVAGNYGPYHSVEVEIAMPKDIQILGTFDLMANDGFKPFYCFDNRIVLPIECGKTWREHFRGSNTLTLEKLIAVGSDAYYQPTSLSMTVPLEVDLGKNVPVALVNLYISYTDIVPGATLETVINTWDNTNNRYKAVLRNNRSGTLENFQKLRIDLIVKSDGKGLISIDSCGLDVSMAQKTETATVKCQKKDMQGTVYTTKVKFTDVTGVIANVINKAFPYTTVANIDDSQRPIQIRVFAWDGRNRRSDAQVTLSITGV